MRGSLAILTILLLCCCQTQEPLEDFRVIEDSLMVKIMTDAFILHAAFADTYGAVKDSMSDVYTKQLLDKYQISQSEFEANFDRIFSDPEYADTIYKQITNYANELEGSIDTESELITPQVRPKIEKK